MPLDFEWDRRKDASNQSKHGVGFGEAATVYADPLASIFDDEDHSGDEHREVIIGHSRRGRLLPVAFTERGKNVVRIISARKATRREQKDHEEGTRP